MTEKMKRSNTELSNVVTLDNIEDIGENFFRRTQPKGKIFKGPNWTAYNKENLGSIPREVEKALVEDKKGITKIGFSTQSERFFPKHDNDKLTPGVGSYNISGDLDFTRTGTSFYSSKGFGNGFASSSERFDESKFYYSKYSVGPSDYDPQVNGSIIDNVKKMMKCKSLYNNKKTRSLKTREETPGPCTYNPIKNQYTKKKYLESVFKSKVSRFGKYPKKGSQVLGPGTYFRDEEFVDFNEKYKPNKENYFFKSPHTKKVDLLQKYDIKTKQIPEDAKFKLISQKGKLFNNLYAMNEFISITPSPFALTQKALLRLRRRTWAAPTKQAQPTRLIVSNGGTNVADDTEYIHRVLKRPDKPDLFKLRSPRWKEDGLKLKVPGPAYYHPKPQPKTLSFNRCNSPGVFIVSPGVSNPEDDDPIADNF